MVRARLADVQAALGDRLLIGGAGEPDHVGAVVHCGREAPGSERGAEEISASAPRASTLAFSYRVVAKRKDIPGPRLEKVKLPEPIKELVKPPEPPKVPERPDSRPAPR